jgi:hypothetical protein
MSSEDNMTAPDQPYEEMPSATPPEPREKTYDAEVDGLRQAAKDLDKARAENKIPQAEPEPIDRSWFAGEKTGEDVPQHYTLTKEQAADGLKAAREIDTAAAQPVSNEQLASSIDHVRAQWAAGQHPFDPNAQPQAVQPEQPQPAEAQQQQPQPVDGLDPEISQALQNPTIRDAISKKFKLLKQQELSTLTPRLKRRGSRRRRYWRTRRNWPMCRAISFLWRFR